MGLYFLIYILQVADENMM